jgi:hypothetical protein
MSSPAPINPYAAPTAPVEDVAANPESDAIRRAHIGHEASVKAVGFLYYLGGGAVTVGALVFMRSDIATSIGLLIAGAAQLSAGYGVRALRGWGRAVGCVLSALGLFAFPVGTLINGYILYLFLSKKGRTIFAPEYQDVIAETPDVKYRTSIVVWIVLALLVILVAAAFVLPQLASRR